MKYFIGSTFKSMYLISHRLTLATPHKLLKFVLQAKKASNVPSHYSYNNQMDHLFIFNHRSQFWSHSYGTLEEFYDVDENHADYRSNVDTSRPFRSVKEAVAVFGERSLVGEIETPIFSPSQNVCKESWSSYGQNISLSDTVKKLEAELEETKAELKLLKEKESDTEVALAMLNAELHESMSKLAQVDHLASSSTPVRGAGDMITKDDQEEKRESRTSSQNLREILNVGQSEGLFWGKKVVKKKPIIPLVGGLFSVKKRPSTSMYSSLHSSSRLHWN